MEKINWTKAQRKTQKLIKELRPRSQLATSQQHSLSIQVLLKK